VSAIIRRGAWPEAPLFGLVQRLGGVSDAEMFHVFNMGLGMLVVVPPEAVKTAQAAVPGELAVVGKVISGDNSVSVLRG
jgi:phosphoribosylformylglycinamidine cyclo-ligase